jgi:biotin-(acetyl-CoA carboxylase) ligase
MLDLPEIRKKTPKAPFKKSAAVRELEALANKAARIKYPNTPDYAFAPRKFRDDSANGLTSCIVKYITFRGGFASRINSTGVYNQKLRKYIPGTSRKGLADIMATYKGKSLHIEVKIGKDRQSEYQMKVEADVMRSGGLYFIAKDFDSFKVWFDNISDGKG